MRFRPWWVAVLVLPACSGQSGGESPSEDNGLTTGAADEFACNEISRRQINLDDITPLGFSAQDVLDQVLQRFDATLQYRDDIHPLTALQLEPIYSQGEAVFIDTDREPDAGASIFECQDRVEIRLDMMLSTDDGRLNEALPVQLRATAPSDAGFAVDIAAEDLQGSLRFEDFDAMAYERRRFGFRAVIEDGRTAGHVSGVGESLDEGTNADTTSQTTIDIGQWPEAAGE